MASGTCSTKRTSAIADIAKSRSRRYPKAVLPRTFGVLFILLGTRILPACAQVLEVNGGSSTLYQAQGGSIILHGSAYESEVGAGLVAGKLVAGGHLAYRDKSNTYTAGVEEIRFDLPTDLFDAGHRLLGVGVGMKSVLPSTKLELFAGGTSQRFDTPLFTGVRADQPAAAFLLQHAFSKSVVTTTQLLAASPGTALQAVQWKAKPWLNLAASGGFGGTSHYEAISVSVKRPLVDLNASYVDAPMNFHRVGAEPEISPEPIHENLLFTVRSSRNPRVTVTGGRQNFLVPANSVTSQDGTLLPNLISTSNQISLSTKVKSVDVTGTVIKSSYDGLSNMALVISAAAKPTDRIHVESSFFQSRLLSHSSLLSGLVTNPVTNTFVTNLQETLTRRLSVNQTITYSNGQTTFGNGGSILFNFLTFSADYETIYIPTRPSNPFEQTLIFDFELNFFGRATVQGGTFISPVGKVLYTANLHAIESRTPGGPQVEHARIGAYIVQGRVVDTGGDPIPGAAVELGGSLLFTDTLGEFFLRDTRSRTYLFKVVLPEFLDGHSYRVVSQPSEVTSVKTGDQHLLIIVERVRDRPAASDSCPPSLGPNTKESGSSSQRGCIPQIIPQTRPLAKPRKGASSGGAT